VNKLDKDAFERAIATLRSDPELASSIEAMLHSQGEQAAGEFASGLLQVRSLRLRPCEAPPIDSTNVEIPSDRYGCRASEVALLRKMLSLGLSRFECDPLAAIERAERERAA
jgi:hypothetical protein